MSFKEDNIEKYRQILVQDDKIQIRDERLLAHAEKIRDLLDPKGANNIVKEIRRAKSILLGDNYETEQTRLDKPLSK